MKQTHLLCPNQRGAKSYEVYDTESFYCSSCGALIRVEEEAKRYRQKASVEEWSASRRKLRGELISKLHLRSLGVLAVIGFLFRSLGFYVLALLFLIVLWFFYARLRRKPYVTLLRFAACGLSAFILGGVAHDVADPPSARCNDGTYSYSSTDSGTCSWHLGVGEWNPRPWWRARIG
jgi:Protein of unknown function (DUF3761)